LSIVALVLSACGHVPVSTIWALRNLDAITLDPALLRAAVRVPDTLQPQPDGVKLEIGWWRDGEEDRKHNAKFVLQETTSADDTAPLVFERKAGMRVYVYRVDPADIPGIRALQAQAKDEKAKNPGKTHGTFGFGADACRKGQLAEGPVLMTTFLRLDSERGYLPVVKDLDLRTAVTTDKSFDELVPPCEKFANRVKSKVDP
jgi:hypothetical protein